jgi:GGDEF domain-containing protein
MTRAPNHYRSLVCLLSNILEAHTVAFFLADSKRQQLRLVAAQSLSKNLRENSTLPFEASGLLAQVQRSGQSIHMDKVGTQDIEAALPFYREGESLIKALFIAPVGDGAGVLFVDTKYSWGFNDKQRKWIGEIAALLNELLQHNQSLVRERDYAQILELWHHLDQVAFDEFNADRYLRAVVKDGAAFLRADFGFLAVREPQSDSYQLHAVTDNVSLSFREQPFPIDQGLVGWIFQNQKNLLIRRLRPQAEKHFLFFPREKFPHQGTFWGLYSQIPQSHAMALVFLSRQPHEWHTDDQYAIERVARFTNLMLERIYLNRTCEHLQTCDPTTGAYTAPAFEALLERQIIDSLSRSVPFTVVLLQFGPWDVLHAHLGPARLRACLQELVQGFRQLLPAEVITGQVAENRVAALFKGYVPKEIETHLARLQSSWCKGPLAVAKALRLKLHWSVVSCPQDASNSEQLWLLAYQKLLGDERAGSETAG